MDWPYEIAERDHEIQNPTSAEKILLLGSYLRLSAESRVLDVACGKGGPAAILAAAYGCRITGVEIRAGIRRRRPRARGMQRAWTGWWRSGLPTRRQSSSSPPPSTSPSASAPPSSGDRSPTPRLRSGRRSGPAASSRSASRSGAVAAPGRGRSRGLRPARRDGWAPRGGRLRADGARRCVRGRLGPLREPALAGDGGVAGRAARRGASRPTRTAPRRLLPLAAAAPRVGDLRRAQGLTPTLTPWPVAPDQLDVRPCGVPADRGLRVPLLPPGGDAREPRHAGRALAPAGVRARADPRLPRRRLADPCPRRAAVLLRPHDRSTSCSATSRRSASSPG